MVVRAYFLWLAGSSFFLGYVYLAAMQRRYWAESGQWLELPLSPRVREESARIEEAIAAGVDPVYSSGAFQKWMRLRALEGLYGRLGLGVVLVLLLGQVLALRTSYRVYSVFGGAWGAGAAAQGLAVFAAVMLALLVQVYAPVLAARQLRQMVRGMRARPAARSLYGLDDADADADSRSAPQGPAEEDLRCLFGASVAATLSGLGAVTALAGLLLGLHGFLAWPAWIAVCAEDVQTFFLSALQLHAAVLGGFVLVRAVQAARRRAPEA